MDSKLVFRCTRTGSYVQVCLPRPPEPDCSNTYEAVRCPACGRIHLVNRTTGKALSEKQ